MADLSKIRLNNTNYNLKDKQVREFLKTGWIPTGMEYVDFYDSENQTYLISYSQCQILCWTQNEGTEENPVYKKILFYSTGENADGKYFHALDGKSLSYHPREARWYYHDPEIDTDITSGSEGFPNIQAGYKFPNGVYSTFISMINTSSILCAEDSPSFLYNKIASGIQVIATIELSGYTYSCAPLIHSTNTSAYFFIVNADECKLIEITNTQIPDSNQVPSDLRNKYECNFINFHEPETDSDVDDMLESLDLTVIDDDNLVGSAEIGSGNVVNWNPAKQVSGGGVFNVSCSVEQGTHGATTYTTYTLNKTWKEIHDAQMAGQSVVISMVVTEQESAWIQLDGTDMYTNGTDLSGTLIREYAVHFGGQYGLSLTTTSETGYPAYTSTE